MFVGIDGTSTKLLQCVIEVVAQPLMYMFNLSFNSGVFPTKLKMAKVVLIFKEGDADSLANFRPVSVLSAISKIIEKLMYTRMMSFVINYSLLSNCQYGFRSGKSTQDAVVDVIECVTKRLDDRDSVSALYVDVAKAFNSVDQDILLLKLYRYGFRGIAYDWFSSYISNRKQHVEVDGSKSLLCTLHTRVLR